MFENLINWSKEEYSHLPWRKNRTLYTTLVSEIMLQQTTVPTVINKFGPFLKRFPNLKKLSEASDEEVCIAWKGLGYYSRARNLRKTAIQIVKNHNSRIPKDPESLKNLTGIGEYTTNAILSIGHRQNFLALDANIERVLCRFLGPKLTKGPKLKKELKDHLEKIKFNLKIKSFCPRELNEALMDLGRVYCQANKADCENCLISKNCKAYKLKDPLSYPVPQKKEKKLYQLELLRILLVDGEKVLVHKRKKGQWLVDQWELPTFIIKSEDKSLNQYPKLEKLPKISKEFAFKSSITKYKITNHVVKMNLKQFKKEVSKDSDFKFVSLDKNLTTATIKALRMSI